MNSALLALLLALAPAPANAQEVPPVPAPPMGWMSWNLLGDQVNQTALLEMADALVSSGMAAAGYDHLFIDDGWQGGRDHRNNLIADPVRFPSGIQALAEQLHQRGLKLGIYSDAAQLTCAGYTASLGFEEQDARTFAAWGIDYLKYDYCHAPADPATALARYGKMADALRASGRAIVLGVCEWGVRAPWTWAREAGGQVWRTTYDIRDKWKDLSEDGNAEGILDILDINAGLHAYAGPGGWNDPDMLVAGLHGRQGPSGDMGGTGCTDTEYQSQFSLWAMMAAPLYASNDLRHMDAATARTLLNTEVIALDQDPLGRQAERLVHDAVWDIFVKPLANGDHAVAVLNRSDVPQDRHLRFSTLGLNGRYRIRDLWLHKAVGRGRFWQGTIQPHETKVFRLSAE